MYLGVLWKVNPLLSEFCCVLETRMKLDETLWGCSMVAGGSLVTKGNEIEGWILTFMTVKIAAIICLVICE